MNAATGQNVANLPPWLATDQATEAAPKSELQKALDAMESAVAMNAGLLSDLVARLKPVLRPEQPMPAMAEGSNQTAPPRSPIGDHIAHLTARLQQQAAAISALSQRLST